MSIDLPTAQMLITSLINWIKVYTDYRVEMRKLDQEITSSSKELIPPVDKPATNLDLKVVEQGEKGLALVRRTIEDHGTEEDKGDLISYEANPTRYQHHLQHILLDIAKRNPGFVEELRALEATNNTQRSGTNSNQYITGNINQNIGLNQGTTIYYDQNRKETE